MKVNKRTREHLLWLRGCVTKRCLAKGYFQDEDRGCEASARTQVYLSKTKLKNTSGDLAIYIVKVQIGLMCHNVGSVSQSGVSVGTMSHIVGRMSQSGVRCENKVKESVRIVT